MRRVRHGNDNVVKVVEEAVAAETGRDPGELPPVRETIDASALDSLFGRGAVDDMQLLTFRYAGCLVTIDCDAVTVEVIENAVPRTAPVRQRNRG